MVFSNKPIGNIEENHQLFVAKLKIQQKKYQVRSGANLLGNSTICLIG